MSTVRKPLDGQIPFMLRCGLDEGQFEYLMECATLYADKIRETGMAPIQAMQVCLMTYALCGASCGAGREDLQTITNDNMDDLLRIAQEFVRTCPRIGEDCLADGWRQRIGAVDIL